MDSDDWFLIVVLVGLVALGQVIGLWGVLAVAAVGGLALRQLSRG